MDNEIYLFLAFGISWIVFAVYIWSLNSQSRNLTEDVETLRKQANSDDQ
jgi:CcmD family protein